MDTSELHLSLEQLQQAMQNNLASSFVHNFQMPARHMFIKANNRYDQPPNDMEMMPHMMQEDVRSYLGRDVDRVAHDVHSRVGYDRNVPPTQEEHIIPMPLQIKAEQEDFYEVDQDFVIHTQANLQMSQPQSSHQPTPCVPEDMFVYYTQDLVPIQNVGPVFEIFTRQQPFIENFNVNDNNPQNLCVQRFDAPQFADTKIIKTEEQSSVTKESSNPFEEENENDSSGVNIIPPSDDTPDDKEYNIKGEFSCCKCNETFTTKRTLKQHTKLCLLGESIDKPGKFNCTQCAYKCHSPAILKIHCRTHTGEKPFACIFCDYKSGQKNNVAKHMFVHMKEKPFKCQYCDYRCAQKNNLVVHERTHTGYKPFACTYCEYRTVQKPNLVKHMYLHTDQKPFSCDICSYRCVQKTNLTKHKQRHLNEKEAGTVEGEKESKPYKPRQRTIHCLHCNYKCVQQPSLDKHMQLKHPELDKEGLDEKEYAMQGLNLMKNAENLTMKKDDDDEDAEAMDITNN